MRTKIRKLRPVSSAVFAPAISEDHPLKIAQFRAWRVKEPVSNRRYTIVRLQSQGGVSGYGEGGPATAAEIVAARAATVDRRATESEFIRSALRRTPALEAAVNNAMLDLVSRAKNVPIYRYLGGPVRYKARLLGHLEGTGPADSAPSLERAKRQGIQAFTTAAPLRDAMIPLRAYVDVVRKHYADMQALAGPFLRMGSRWRGRDDAGRCRNHCSRARAVSPHLVRRAHGGDKPRCTGEDCGRIRDADRPRPEHHRSSRVPDPLASGSVNVVRPDLALNSLTKIKRLAALAETHYVGIAPFHNGGPIGSMAGIHLNASLLYAYAQQIPVPASDRDAAMRAEITSGVKETGDKGFFGLVNRPGLGFEVNEKALDAWSEERV